MIIIYNIDMITIIKYEKYCKYTLNSKIEDCILEQFN